MDNPHVITPKDILDEPRFLKSLLKCYKIRHKLKPKVADDRKSFRRMLKLYECELKIRKQLDNDSIGFDVDSLRNPQDGYLVDHQISEGTQETKIKTNKLDRKDKGSVNLLKTSHLISMARKDLLLQTQWLKCSIKNERLLRAKSIASSVQSDQEEE